MVERGHSVALEGSRKSASRALNGSKWMLSINYTLAVFPKNSIHDREVEGSDVSELAGIVRKWRQDHKSP
jgi:hypothetical protein